MKHFLTGFIAAYHIRRAAKIKAKRIHNNRTAYRMGFLRHDKITESGNAFSSRAPKPNYCIPVTSKDWSTAVKRGVTISFPGSEKRRRRHG